LKTAWGVCVGGGFQETLSQPLAGCGGAFMSSQLRGRLRLGRSQFQDSPEKKVVRPMSMENSWAWGMVACASHPSDSGEQKIESHSRHA
jgi:hypothetical protein